NATDTLSGGLCQGFSHPSATRARRRRGCARTRLRRHRLPLPWFRRKRSEEQARDPRAATEVQAVDAPPVARPAVASGRDGDESTTSTARKRRRGTRGGRGRSKKATFAVAASDAPASATATATERKPSERKTRTTQTRRRSAPKRAPLPKAKRELLVSVDAGEKRVAVLEDDRVAEVYLE